MAKTAKCLICGRQINENQILSHTFSRDYGRFTKTIQIKATPIHYTSGIGYVCADCLKDGCNASDGGTYNRENHIRKSKPTEQGYTISQEYEVSKKAANLTDEQICQIFGECMIRKAIPTSDCTVLVEMKTSVYNGLNGFSKDMKSIIEHTHLAEWANGGDYGTHTNIGHTDLGYEEMKILRFFRETLLTPIQNYLVTYGDRCKDIFSRKIGGWADVMNFEGPDQHGVFINLQHINENEDDKNWVEFRINKITSYEQNSYAIKVCIALFDEMLKFAKAVIRNRRTYSGQELRNINMETARKYADRLVKTIDKMWTAKYDTASEIA